MADCVFPSRRRCLNLWGTFLALLMIMSGCLVCAGATQISQARDFMLGIYFVGFGLFATVIEFKQFDNVTKWFPALDVYFGKGVCWVFWGFLLFAGSIEWQILAFLFLASGVVFMLAEFGVDGGPLHLLGERPAGSGGGGGGGDKAAYESEGNRDGAMPPAPDPYLAGVSHPDAAGDDRI